MLFEDIIAGQRFRFKNNEYLKIPEVKKTCCQIEANAIRLKDNQDILFEYKAEVEVVVDDQQ